MCIVVGTVPGPLIFGLVFDHSCIAWQEKCGSRGTCWLYDSPSLSYRIFGSMFALVFASNCFIIAALCLYKPPSSSEAPPSVVGGGGAKGVSTDSTRLIAQPSLSSVNGKSENSSVNDSLASTLSSSASKKSGLRYTNSTSSSHPMLPPASDDIADGHATNGSNRDSGGFGDATDDGFQTAFLSTAV